MNNTDLPPLPPTGVISQEVCDAVSLYLAVSHDLTEEQKHRVSVHLKVCPQCVREYRLVKRSAQLVSSLEGSEPSARVDVAVMAAIAARASSGIDRYVDTSASLRSIPFNRNSGGNRRRRVPVGSLVAAAAVLIVALVGVLHFVIMPGSASAFQVPAGSWNGVIYHTQTVVSSNGDQYHVATYHDMMNDMMNVETTMGTKLDVMVVSDGNQTLGMDMKNNVAQMNANAWLSDDSLFNLKQLNQDLQAHRATYLGISQYNGQEVYRIRDQNGEILLLDMKFKPVNVLQDANGSGPAKAVYDKMQFLDNAPTGMFDTKLPKGFKMGALPAKP
jgi:hypothetical protein